MFKKILLICCFASSLFASIITIHDIKENMVNACMLEKNSKKICECAEELTHREYNLLNVAIKLNSEDQNSSIDFLNGYDLEKQKSIISCKKLKAKLPKDTRTLSKLQLDTVIEDTIRNALIEKGSNGITALKIADCVVKNKNPYEYSLKYAKKLTQPWYFYGIDKGYVLENKLNKYEQEQFLLFSNVVTYVLDDEQTMYDCTIDGMPKYKSYKQGTREYNNWVSH